MGAEVSAGVLACGEVGGEDGGWLGSVRAIWSLIVQYHPSVILYEHFILGAGGEGGMGGGGWSSAPEGLDAVRVESGIRSLLSWAWDPKQYEWLPFELSVKGVMTDDRMAKWGLWYRPSVDRQAYKGWKGHATDAARGLVWYLREVLN